MYLTVDRYDYSPHSRLFSQGTTASFNFHQMAVHKRTTMLAHCNLKKICGCLQNNLAFFLLCTALWWQIKRHGGPFKIGEINTDLAFRQHVSGLARGEATARSSQDGFPWLLDLTSQIFAHRSGCPSQGRNLTEYF